MKLLTRLRKWPTRLRVHILRSLSITNTYLTATYSYIIVPGQMVVCLVYSVMSNYIAIRLYDVLSLSAYLPWPLCALVCFAFELLAYTKAAQVLDDSQTVLSSAKSIVLMGSMDETRQIRREFGAFQHLRVDMGHFFAYRKSTVMNFFSVVTEYTFTLLML